MGWGLKAAVQLRGAGKQPLSSAEPTEQKLLLTWCPQPGRPSSKHQFWVSWKRAELGVRESQGWPPNIPPFGWSVMGPFGGAILQGPKDPHLTPDGWILPCPGPGTPPSHPLNPSSCWQALSKDLLSTLWGSMWAAGQASSPCFSVQGPRGPAPPLLLSLCAQTLLTFLTHMPSVPSAGSVSCLFSSGKSDPSLSTQPRQMPSSWKPSSFPRFPSTALGSPRTGMCHIQGVQP